VPEGEKIHLEATFQPARDPELKAVWQKNGQPLGASQLVQTRQELGWATLDILSANEDHNGVYTLTITNSEGEAVSTAMVKVVGSAPVIGDTRHEESWRRIQILEAPKEAPEEAPAPVYDRPTITKQIVDQECNEGDHIHFEGTFTPVNDPNLTYNGSETASHFPTAPSMPSAKTSELECSTSPIPIQKIRESINSKLSIHKVKRSLRLR
ncbi:immunoglobulin I-set domain protein, partial [Ancylostoma duodenale]